MSWLFLPASRVSNPSLMQCLEKRKPLRAGVGQYQRAAGCDDVRHYLLPEVPGGPRHTAEPGLPQPGQGGHTPGLSPRPLRGCRGGRWVPVFPRFLFFVINSQLRLIFVLMLALFHLTFFNCTGGFLDLAPRPWQHCSQTLYHSTSIKCSGWM